MAMLITYGQGEYTEGPKRLSGEIVLGPHRLYLKDGTGDLAATYIPLEKIARMRLKGTRLILSVRPSLTVHYTAVFQGSRRRVRDLAHDLAARRCLKKRFFSPEWFDEDF